MGTMPQYVCIIFSFLFGCLSAFAELLSKYKNIKIRKILLNWGSGIYLLINGLSSILAFYLLGELGVLNDSVVQRIIFGGLASMIIIRSSFSNIKVGNRDIKLGIGEIFQIFLDTAENYFDIKRSEEDAVQIERIMGNVDFNKAKTALSVTCFNLMKNLPKEEQQSIDEEVIKISETNFSNKTKSINLGIILSKVTGLQFLNTAIKALGDDIKLDGNNVNDMDTLLEKLK